jgi:predicted signal transduction protein with EAL and GGDEF domain
MGLALGPLEGMLHPVLEQGPVGQRATAELATSVLERLRAVTPAGQAFSAGVATWDGNETSEELIGRADQALYQAKDDGRDRIVVAAEEAQTASQPGPGV